MSCGFQALSEEPMFQIKGIHVLNRGQKLTDINVTKYVLRLQDLVWRTTK